MSDHFTTVVTAEPRYNLAVQEGGGLTLSLLGPSGPAGATGATGAAGPNEITTSTETGLTGYIYGDGTAIGGATAGAVSPTVSTLVLRDNAGASDFIKINLGNLHTGGSPSAPYGIIGNTALTGSSGVGISGNPDVALEAATHRLTLSSTGVAIASGTITTSQPLSLTQTWNAAGVTFKGIDVNVTDTASASGSLLMDLRFGNTSKFKVDKSGKILLGGNNASASINYIDQNQLFLGASIGGGSSVHLYESGGRQVLIGGGGVAIRGDLPLRWGSNSDAGSSVDLFVYKDAANTLAQRNGTSAQTTRIYDTYTSATDFHRLAIATARATATAMSGATVTLTNIIPKGAVVVGVTCKVTTAITGATSFDIGTAADPDRFGAAIGVASGITSDNTNWTAGGIECFTSATSIILTANGSNFTAGAVYVSVQYLSGQAD